MKSLFIVLVGFVVLSGSAPFAAAKEKKAARMPSAAKGQMVCENPNEGIFLSGSAEPVQTFINSHCELSKFISITADSQGGLVCCIKK